jgi:UDP-3-O-[3-hydroxymyristoyl] glucosamine N-acyltransferase
MLPPPRSRRPRSPDPEAVTRVSDGWLLSELASAVGGRVDGDANRRVRGVATLDDAGPDDLSFLTNPRYRPALERTRAGAILVGPGVGIAGRDLLVVSDPYLALAEILDRMHPAPRPAPGISPDARVFPGSVLGADVAIGPFAVVGPGARLADRVVVGAGAVIGDGSSIGADTVLMPRVVLYPGTSVGARCLIHAGVVLGGDGFGFATAAGTHKKVPQLGRVVVEDDVEIGANSTVDRGTLGETRIGGGTKIDNLVMVAHGVVIGPHGLLAGQAGIAGSTRIGKSVTMAGQSGAAGHLKLGDRVVVAAKTAVFSDLPDGAFVAGTPAVDHRAWKRSLALVKMLPELRAKLRTLEERLATLESREKGNA